MAKTKTMEENIKNYSNEIVTMTNFTEAVRESVGQFLGYRGNKGFINMIREIFQNSVDELMKDASPCNEIWVYYDEPKKAVTIVDNGRGIPFKDLHRVFTDQFTSSNYSASKKPGEFSSGRHGVGSKVVNAVSEFFIVESFILGEARRISFVDGIQNGDIEVIPNKNNFQGTRVAFKPSFEVMGEITTSYQEVLGLIKSIIPLLKIGAIINFSAIDMMNQKYTEKIVNQYGIITGLMNKTSNPLVKPIVFSDMNPEGTMRANIAFTYDANDLSPEDITAFSNFCPTINESKHVTGFIDGITTFFRNYMNKIYLAKSKTSCINADIKCGLKAILDVAHLTPDFSGQAKEILGNPEMHPYVKGVVMRNLDAWSRTNPSELQKLCKYFKEVADIRAKSDKEKVKLSSTYQPSVISGLPKKYTKPTGKEHLELIIMEGDSAAGSGKSCRCSRRQGIFPIRGKMPNAFNTPRAKFLANEEVGAILTIIGAGYGNNFDISKCIWEKIIIGADADPDGAHIRSLFLKFMLLYCRPIITSGRLYSLVPPLFGIKEGKKFRYFTEKIDFTKYIQKEFSRENHVTDINGNPFNNSAITEILFKNMEYVHDLESIAGTFAIDPKLLEKIIAYENLPYAKFKKEIEKSFRFIKVSQKNDIRLIMGLVGNKYQTVVFNDKLSNSCNNIRHYLDGSPNLYKMNNTVVTLYELMAQFEKYIPSNLTRYKGLGEMNDDQLGESALHPDSNRTLMRYTIEDVKAEIDAIRAIESDKSVLMKDIKVSKSDIS